MDKGIGDVNIREPMTNHQRSSTNAHNITPNYHQSLVHTYADNSL